MSELPPGLAARAEPIRHAIAATVSAHHLAETLESTDPPRILVTTGAGITHEHLVLARAALDAHPTLDELDRALAAHIAERLLPIADRIVEHATRMNAGNDRERVERAAHAAHNLARKLANLAPSH